MSPLRRLLVAVLALAGALAWGPPVVLALCLSGGNCTMHASPRAEVPACCSHAPEKGPAVKSADDGCCGCCAKIHVGLGVDGGGVRVETPVAPPAASPVVVLPAPKAEVALPATPVGPRAPPERVLPLRI